MSIFHPNFPTEWDKIIERISRIDAVAYAKSRNFADGALTYLGPYISRGVISTQMVYNSLVARGIPWEASEKLVQELAWRDYWQRVWQHERDNIFGNLKNNQNMVEKFALPKALVEAKTGIKAINSALQKLKENGYMHNHMRMYVASICCNIARAPWQKGARWMYYYLLDGDLASNHLSWQWVAGTNSKKLYFANQDNINRFFGQNQKGTFLDVDYSEFPLQEIPEQLECPQQTDALSTDLSHLKSDFTLENKKTLIYTYYNLDPNWHVKEDWQRVLLLEPSVFKQYPVAEHCLDFALALGQNIPNLKVFVGEFSDLKRQLKANEIRYKEHPLSRDFYEAKEEARDWLSPPSNKLNSFFSFWKPCKKFLLKELTST